MATTKCSESIVSADGVTTKVIYNEKYKEFYVVKSNSFNVEVIPFEIGKLIYIICKENKNVIKKNKKN